MPYPPEKPLLRYGIAVVVTAAALVLTLELPARFVNLSPLFCFYIAVALSSWFGGAGPGLVTLVVGALSVDYFVLHPRDDIGAFDSSFVPRLVLFAMAGTLVALLNGALHRSRRRCELEAEGARRNEARAKRLAEANLIGVFFSDLDGKIRWANREFLRLVDRTEAEVAAGTVNWKEVTAPEHRDRDERAMIELKQCRVCKPFEKDHLLHDGERVPVLVGCAVVEDPMDDVVGYVLDLTERKRAEERLRKMGSELMLAEERERRRIATVLHDSVVQMMALAKMKVERIRASTNGAKEKGWVEEVYQLLEDSIARTRTLTAEISPPILYELGLGAAIQWLGDRFREEHALSVEFVWDKRRNYLSEEARLMLFQGTRELLMNVVKHARASRCVITKVDEDGELRLSVEDNGNGLLEPRERDYSKGGLGLFNIRQRLAHLGGRLEIGGSALGGGKVTLIVPIARKQGSDAKGEAVSTAS